MEQQWLHAPACAYRRWQENDATGADGRPFSARSIIQHTAMFERFVRHLAERGVDVAGFGEDHLASFLADLEGRCAPGTSTARRYARLLDRLCRHLVDTGLRDNNPVATYARRAAFGTLEPDPVFLDEAADAHLQAFVAHTPRRKPLEIRNIAAVALLHATGITSAEIRRTRRGDVVLDGARPQIAVAAHGVRKARGVPIAPFAVRAIDAWMDAAPGDGSDLLFPLRAATGSFCEERLWRAVRGALDAIGFAGADRSPRVLRNTYARRLLLAGETNDDVSRLLGLTSDSTVVRIRATMPPPTIAT